MRPVRFFLSLWLLGSFAYAGAVEEYAAKIAPLIDPAKLSTLGPRRANSRVQKITFWLASAKMNGVAVEKIAEAAVKSVGMTNALAAQLTKAAMLRNVTIAEQLGCLDKLGIDEMRKGRAATIKRGPYVGDALSVDHIIPRSVVTELDNVIANLELMPQRVEQIREAVTGGIAAEVRTRIGYYSPDEFIAWLNTLAPVEVAPISSEPTVTLRRGRKVTRKVQPLTPDEQRRKEAERIAMIAEVMRRRPN
jgi:hypothetical protein